MEQSFLDGRVRLFCSDCLSALKAMPDHSIDSIVTDPPYGLSKEPDMMEVLRHWMAGDDYAHTGAGFMGRKWDSFVPGPSIWRECLRVLKPGGHLVSFGGTRTYDMMVLAIRLAGFEIRDQLSWNFGTGFPKSMNVGKAINAHQTVGASRPEDIRRLAMDDEYEPSGRGRVNYDHGCAGAMNGSVEPSELNAEAQKWSGFGTALKPAFEPIVLARKPLIGTVAENVLQHGTGALNIDGCRIAVSPADAAATEKKNAHGDFDSKPRGQGLAYGSDNRRQDNYSAAKGRFPANVLHDGSDEVIAALPETTASSGRPRHNNEYDSVAKGHETEHVTFGHFDAGGSAARYFASFPNENADSAQRLFYSAKANPEDRAGSKHPTVKPVDLMQWLCRLVTPPGGTVLDPFAGTGTTGEAAWREGFSAVLIEMTPEYQVDIARRIKACPERAAAARRGKKTVVKPKPADPNVLGSLFG